MLENKSGDNHFAVLAKKESTGDYQLTLAVQGVHCASCIQLIENALYADKAVTAARVNMSTERLSFSWRGKQSYGDVLANLVIKLGYGLTALDTKSDLVKKSQQEKTLLLSLVISGFAAGNLMLISMGLWFSPGQDMGVATKDLLHWFSTLIALPAIVFSGRVFFYSAWRVLKSGHTNMDVPISLAIILATAMSVFETINHGKHIYFDSALMLIFFLLIGRYLDIKVKGKAKETAQNLLSMLTGKATVLIKGKQTPMAISDLRQDMIVLVATGERIPADGMVVSGRSELDMSLITGETLPVSVKEKDAVFAGTINLMAPLKIAIAKASDNSLLSQIVKLMETAEQGQGRYVRLADKAARLYTPLVHSLGLATFIFWWLLMGADWQVALLYGVTVLIITCPCALGLAVPVVQVLASSRLMKQGVLLKSGDALEKLANIDVAIFDKTGTLTSGNITLSEHAKYSADDLKLAASLATHSKHPLSQALSRAYGGQPLLLTDVKEKPGKGLQAMFAEKEIKLGSRFWCGDSKATQHSQLEIWLSVSGEKPIQFLFSDQLRTDAKRVISLFQQAGIAVVMLSGDRKAVVESVAKKLKINRYQAQYSPLDKCHYLQDLKAKGQHILMVGDGLNDAPSLATADVSISPASAIDISQNTADIVFQGESLNAVLSAWQIARYTKRLVQENFILAILYNMIAIPLAVMGFVTPLIAAIAMSASSLLVIANSFRLNRQKTIADG